MPITIANRLNILPGNKIQVPMCEPLSETTSIVLVNEMKKAGVCTGQALVTLQAALTAIPGSSVVLAGNFGVPTQKYFVLPEVTINCPCTIIDDWYAKLREVAEPVEQADDGDTSLSNCETLDPNVRGGFNT